jgi:hypothetical protein
MVKLSLMLMLGIVCNYSGVRAEGFNTSIKKSLDTKKPLDARKIASTEESTILPSANEIKTFFYEQIKSLSIFAEPINSSQLRVQSSNFLSALMNSAKQEPPSKYRASKVFELGMNMAISPKISWGAEVSVSKYKNNFESEAKPKPPLKGFRLRPDIYTFQVGLKYKI